MSWRDNLQPASFRGVRFQVENSTVEGGRRHVPHEYPKRDAGLTEDMGRRLRHSSVRGYLIGGTHDQRATALIGALEADGPGLLVLPLRGQMPMICQSFSCTEAREDANFTAFDMDFLEAGSTSAPTAVRSTISAVISAAGSASTSISAALNSAIGGL